MTTCGTDAAHPEPGQAWTQGALGSADPTINANTYTVSLNRMCLDTENGSKQAGARVVVAVCNGGVSQRWIRPDPNSTQLVREGADGCLTRDDANVVLQSCTPGPTNLWTPTPVVDDVTFPT
jgi:hypothetical protein